MFTDIFLNPKELTKERRIEKIKNLCANNVVFKHNFSGFKYMYFAKEKLYEKKNIKHKKINNNFQRRKKKTIPLRFVNLMRIR